jgi:hypothetical protein
MVDATCSRLNARGTLGHSYGTRFAKSAFESAALAYQFRFVRVG